MRPLDPRLLSRARSARTLLSVDVVVGVATALLVLAQATLLARIVARAFTGTSLAALSLDIALLASAFVARGALAWAFEILGRRAASRVLSELRMELVARRLRSQPAALDGVQGAEIAAVAVQGIEALEAYFARYLPQVVLACVVPVAVIAWIVPFDLQSAGILLLTLPLIPVFMWLVGTYTAQRTRERWQALVLLSTHFLDVVRGLPTLRAFNRGQLQAEQIGRISEQYRRTTMATLRLSFLSGSVLELAATMGVALVAVTIGVRLVDGGIGLQAGLTVLVLAPEVYLPFRQLGVQYHASADGLAVFERMLTLLEAPTESVSGGTRPAPSPAHAAVQLERVSFSYPTRPALVLDRFDLQLSPGETVALVGPSGAGKSTVAALIMGFALPSAGRITVGGIDLGACDPNAWRRQIAWVPQQPTLMHGTVADNIKLGDLQASREQIEQAARLAGADGFVRSLPRRYETVIGEGGRPLSTGERRRLGLARAFLRDASLVILDEPTADLDRESAELVSQVIERVRSGRTVLLIAHHQDLVARADRVVIVGADAPALGDRQAA